MRRQSRKKSERKPVPAFRSEREERAFWETHDTVDYVDWSEARAVRLPNLKPSTTTISLRLPAPLLADIKALANERDVPYQSLLKVYLAERVTAEHGRLLNQRSERTGRRAVRHGRTARAARRSTASR